MADPLATLLVQEGALTLDALVRGQARQRQQGGSLDSALLELGAVSEPVLREALARASGLPPADPGALLDPDVRARRALPSKVAERHGLAPIRLDGRELAVAAIHPVDLAALGEIGFMLSLHINPLVTTEWRVLELRRRVYGTPLPGRYEALAAAAQAAPAGAAPAPEAAPAEPEPEGASPAEPAPAPPASEERSRPPRWDLAVARGVLAAAASRDEVVTVALRYARDFFETAAIFSVSRWRIRGHDALGADPAARERVRAVDVPTEQAATFRAVLDTGGPYLGPPGRDPALVAFGGKLPRTVLLYPVLVRERVPCVLYADNGEAPISTRRVGDLLLLAGALGPAFERVLRSSKRPSPPPGPPPELQPDLPPAPPVVAVELATEEWEEPPAPGGWHSREPALTPPAPLAEIELEPGEYAVAPAAQALAETLAFDPRAAAARLGATARGSGERGRLVAQLVQHGPEAAAALADHFPGPIDPPGAPGPDGGEESRPVDDRGPVLMALAALGIVATPWLVPLLHDVESGRRRYAALLLGHIGDPAAFLPMCDRVFDDDPGVREAALGALAGLRSHPDFRPVLERLRRALAEPRKQAAAAAALRRLEAAGAD